ncbi:MAG: polyprenyl synthetase family protein [Halieaceae bacterium]|jgi:geranylgeranyl pyrophosphate synthase|nr:polyprenyl synthetase family protein [Halieaceae bacterium]
MNPRFIRFLDESRHRCNDALSRFLGEPDSGHHCFDDLGRLFEASHYALSIGGKRIRPTLVYASANAINGEVDDLALDSAAVAVEMIHTYSLVHDDLPAMDDDDLRRGSPSCHKAYGEPCAILVGDGLQSRAFEVLAEAPGLSTGQQVAMIKTLAAASGPRGMVGGQAIDTAASNTRMDLPQLQTMHSLKTGALIRAALALGGIAANANAAQLSALDNYGSDIGLAFQVVDDILDVEGSTATLGKTQGKDQHDHKPTYVALMGLSGAKAEAHRLLDSAVAKLDSFQESADELRELARFIVMRDH